MFLLLLLVVSSWLFLVVVVVVVVVVVGCLLLVVCCWLFVVGCLLLVVCCWLFVLGCLFLVGWLVGRSVCRSVGRSLLVVVLSSAVSKLALYGIIMFITHCSYCCQHGHHRYDSSRPCTFSLQGAPTQFRRLKKQSDVKQVFDHLSILRRGQ